MMYANIIYVIGFFIWYGYAVNRFCGNPAYDDNAMWNFLLAFFWPICVGVYLPYRIFKWLGVKKEGEKV